MNVSAKIQKVVICVVSSRHVSIIICYKSRYGYLRCMKILAIILKNGCFSCSEHRYIFSLRQLKKLVVSVVFAPSRDFLVLKYVLKAGEIEWIEYS